MYYDWTILLSIPSISLPLTYKTVQIEIGLLENGGNP
jgi:hypothetical protein